MNVLKVNLFGNFISCPCHCGLLLVQFAELIKKGSVKVGDVSKVLCQDLSKHCSKTR